MPVDPKHLAEQIAASLDINFDDIGDEIALLLAPVAGDAMRAAMAALGAEKDAFDVADAYGIDYAQRRGAELVGRRKLADGTVIDNPSPVFAITETTRDMVRAKLVEALENGWSVSDLRTAIMEDVFGLARALMIARTETVTAHNAGQIAGAREMGVAFKAWFDAGDEAECEECPGNADEGIIAMDETFKTGDDCPPAHPNCRCSLVFYSQEEAEAESEEGAA